MLFTVVCVTAPNNGDMDCSVVLTLRLSLKSNDVKFKWKLFGSTFAWYHLFYKYFKGQKTLSMVVCFCFEMLHCSSWSNWLREQHFGWWWAFNFDVWHSWELKLKGLINIFSGIYMNMYMYVHTLYLLIIGKNHIMTVITFNM